MRSPDESANQIVEISVDREVAGMTHTFTVYVALSVRPSPNGEVWEPRVLGVSSDWDRFHVIQDLTRSEIEMAEAEAIAQAERTVA